MIRSAIVLSRTHHKCVQLVSLIILLALLHHTLISFSRSVVWARGPNPGSNTLGFHGGSSSTHGSASINFLSASSSGAVVPSPGPDYAPLHAALMFAAFGVFMPFGIFIGRYLKRYWWWFPLRTVLSQRCTN